MGARAYTASSPAIAPPLYLQVNVYRTKSGWMCSTAIKQAGGRSPRTNRRLTTFHVCKGDHSIAEAAAMAAGALRGYSG